MQLTDLIPDPDDLLALQPEELAGVLIEFFNSLPPSERHQISRYNFTLYHTVAAYPQNRRPECQQALMEAWQVLEGERLLAHQPEDMNGSWFVITRRGRKIRSRDEFASFLHTRQFPKESIHPDLREMTFPLFLRGDYETAIFQAFKRVEVRVREACATLDTKLYGVDLMRQAFHPESGPLTDLSEPISERQALQALFAGAIGRFKNPASHRHVPVSSPTETVEMLQFASHLMRVLDDRMRPKAP